MSKPTRAEEPQEWHLEVFTADDRSQPFTAFLEKIDDFKAVALDTALRLLLAKHGIALAGSEWLKPLGEGLHEFRVRHTADEIARMFGGEQDDKVAAAASHGAVLLRTFVHFHGRRIVLLLAGYDKGTDPSKRTQQKEIAAARKLLKEFQGQQARAQKAEKGGRPPTGRGR